VIDELILCPSVSSGVQCEPEDGGHLISFDGWMSLRGACGMESEHRPADRSTACRPVNGRGRDVPDVRDPSGDVDAEHQHRMPVELYEPLLPHRTEVVAPLDLAGCRQRNPLSRVQNER
jgi:hypothetical protein